MKPLTIYRDNPTNTTLLSNRFIDEYMKDANDAQLKIYLYLTRMLGSELATSISDIADTFNHTEKDVLRALKYWEKHRLLSLDYNDTKTLVGIQLQDLTKEAIVTTAKKEELPVAPITILNPAKEGTRVLEKATPPPAKVVTFEKPQYSLDQLKEFKNLSSTQEILFIAEQYIGKPLSAKDIQTIFFLFDTLNFSSDLIDYLIQYCVERGKKDFKYIETVAISWAEQKVTTAKQASSITKKYDKTIYTIMKSLGKQGIPTKKELDFITNWTTNFGFSMDIIIEACDRTVLAVDTHRFEYANSILNNWSQSNVHSKSDIVNCDKIFQSSKAAKQSTNNASNKNNTNKFNQFTQRSYDFEQLEKELLSN